MLPRQRAQHCGGGWCRAAAPTREPLRRVPPPPSPAPPFAGFRPLQLPLRGAPPRPAGPPPRPVAAASPALLRALLAPDLAGLSVPQSPRLANPAPSSRPPRLRLFAPRPLWGG